MPEQIASAARLSVCAGMAMARLAELAWSRRNLAVGGPMREGKWSRRTFPAMAALHIGVIGGTFLAGGRRPGLAWLVLLLAAQLPRAWVLVTLGRRWNARGAVAANLDVVTRGPYRFVRHPNYTVVAVELAALPAAFRLYRVALIATVVNACLLALRIREEEALLFAVPGYGEHFAGKPRFLPGLW